MHKSCFNFAHYVYSYFKSRFIFTFNHFHWWILGLTDLPEIMHGVQFLTFNSKSLSLAGHHTQDLKRLFAFIMLRCPSRAKHVTLARDDLGLTALHLRAKHPDPYTDSLLCTR